MIDPKEAPGVVYLLPCSKSPARRRRQPRRQIHHRQRQAAVASPPSSTSRRSTTAIQNKDFSGDEDGIPVLNYDKIKDAEINVGLGPLHTQFDDQGFAYTSLFVESAVAKWKLGTWEVVDKIPVTYNIGHLRAAEGDTVHPDGKYLVALNKLSHGRHLSVGPVAAGVFAADRHHRREDEAALRCLHRARTALCADHQGGQAASRSRCTRRKRTSIPRRSGM